MCVNLPIFCSWHVIQPLFDCTIFLQALNYMIVVFCAYSGDVSSLGLLGDYSKYALNFSEDIYTTGRPKNLTQEPN